MAQRSRKRRPPTRPAATTNGARPASRSGPAGTGAASRSGPFGAGAASPSGPSGTGAASRSGATGAPRERRLRGEERDAAIRARLEPLAPGERPTAVTVAAIVAVVLAVANVIVWLAGWKVGGKQPSTGGALAFPAIMLVAAVAMWHRVYWAVLGFQALLAITMMVSGLSLLLAANITGALVSLAILVPTSALFWFLIRAMARLRLPERPQPEGER